MTTYKIVQPDAERPKTDVVSFKFEMHKDGVAPVWYAKQNGNWVALAHASSGGRLFLYELGHEDRKSLPGLVFAGNTVCRWGVT